VRVQVPLRAPLIKLELKSLPLLKGFFVSGIMFILSTWDSLHFVVDCTALNPLTTGIEQSQTIITKVSISESPFLDELCDVVKAFGSGICNPIFKIIQDLLTPSLKCSS